MVLRKSYLDKIIPFIDQDLIKVLVGIRRCGKTVLLGQIKDVLLQRNIPAQNIIQANFESILLNARRYDIKGKALLSSTEKYYAVDLGLRNVIKKSEKLDSNKLYENIVYLEMRSRGYEVQVGKLDDTEIDFICYRGDEKLYIQVAYLITPADEEREFGNLERLHDNYPKYVISGDLANLSRNGIIHRNIIDFLLNP